MTSPRERVPASPADSTFCDKISATDLAYMAGIVDGEGTITISRMKPKTRRARNGRLYVSSIQHTLSLSVTMSDTEIVRTFHACFGGYINPSPGTNKPMLRWQVIADKAVPPLRALLPYLRSKSRQAILGVMFQTQRTNQSGTISHGDRGRITSKRISYAEMLFREDICAQIQALNQGVGQ